MSNSNRISKKFMRYTYDRLISDKFHHTLLSNFSNDISRLQLDVDMGNQEDDISSYFKKCKSPLDRSKAFLKTICLKGPHEDIMGFETEGFFTDFYMDYIRSLSTNSKPLSSLISFIEKIPSRQLDDESIVDLVVNHGLCYTSIEREFPSDSIMWEIIKKSPEKISLMSRATEDMCIHVVNIDSRFLKNVRAKNRSRKVALASIAKDFNGFDWFPLEHLTQEIAEKAMNENPLNAAIAPDSELKTKSIAKNISKSKAAIRATPERFFTNDFFKLIFKENPDSAWGVLDEFFNKIKVEISDINRDSSLSHFYGELDINFTLLLEDAIKAYPLLSRRVHPSILTEDLMLCVVARNWEVMSLCDPKNLTRRVVEKYIKSNPDKINTIDKRFFDEDMIAIAASRNDRTLSRISAKERTHKVCISALKKSLNEIVLVPEALWLSKEFLLELKNSNPHALVERKNMSRRNKKADTAQYEP